MRFYRTALNFIDNYRALFLNPAENAAEIIVTTALVVIGAFVLWIFGGLVFNKTKRFVQRLRTEKNLSAVFVLYLGALFIFGVFLFAVALPVTSNSSFCGRVCHSMNPEFQSWRRSAHAKVSCISCHAGNSFEGVVRDKLVGGTREAALEVTGKYRKPINAKSSYSQKSVPNERCVRCHSPRTRFFSVRLGLSMDHPAHLEAGLRCTTCHNRVAHPDADKYSPLREKSSAFKYKDFLTMKQGCWRCHRQGGRYVDPGGKSHTGPFVAKTGQKAPTKCTACHSALWKELPDFHRPERGVQWGRGLAHGEEARRDFGKCKGCHETTIWCSTRCHFGITMPHVENWVKIHPVLAKRDKERCYACHKVEKALDFCGQRCHHTSFQEKFKLDKEHEWKEGKEQHGVVVKATGGEPCFRCHEQKTWCATQCHQGITMPHVAGWRGVHYKNVEYEEGYGWRKEKAVCVMCHNKDGNNKNYCFVCHHQRWGARSAMPLMQGVKSQYGVFYDLQPEPRTPCEDCHAHQGLKFCRDCHTGRTSRDSIRE